MTYGEVRLLIGNLPPGGASVFALSCAERVAGLWEQAENRHVCKLIRDSLDQAWSFFEDERAPVADFVALGENLYSQLSNDTSLGLHHSLLFDSVLCVGHALVAVGSVDVSSVAASEAVQSSQSAMTLVKGAFFEKWQTYKGAADFAGAVREERWQARDVELLSGAMDSDLVRRVKARAESESGLVLAGVYEDDWAKELPSDNWQTLF